MSRGALNNISSSDSDFDRTTCLWFPSRDGWSTTNPLPLSSLYNSRIPDASETSHCGYSSFRLPVNAFVIKEEIHYGWRDLSPIRTGFNLDAEHIKGMIQ